MLSKSANSLYLLARYIERAESLSRIINTNSQHLIDGLTNNISEKSYWSRVYSIFPDEKPLNNKNITLDVFCQSSFEFSIKNSIKNAREHARIVRDLISDDMWLELNSLYLYVTAQKGNIDLDNCPSDYFGRVQNSTLLCNGILNSTIERNETWVFYQIGLFLERAEITTRVLSLQFEFSSNDLSYIWNSTLDSCNARSAYHQKYGSDINNFNLCDLLVLSSTFPKSIKFCISKIYRYISMLNKHYTGGILNEAERVAGKNKSTLEFDETSNLFANGLNNYIRNLQSQLQLLSDKIYECYINLSKEFQLTSVKSHRINCVSNQMTQ